ncbi:c-type cytochrome [Dasania marina]|uniref:c-type cytochrome n=1 Tax=Dasania marina TaxID=471499 RepID=UPI0030DBD04E|tara:strand:+ start:57798 stop:58373 length:576 start_codon:yes stop_codon:yes gene_type:complete
MKKITMMAVAPWLTALLLSISHSLALAENAQQLAQSCTACHGAKGLASSTLWPNLAGQNQVYLAEQLRAFRDGSRKDVLMSAAAQGLSEQNVETLATYYSQMTGTGPAVTGPANIAGQHIRGRCISCHGKEGITVNSQWPNIRGQNKAYMQKQLTDFRDGTRHSDVMAVIVKGFTDQQIADVAEYYSQLRP